MALSLKEKYCFLLRIKYHALIRLGVSPLSSAQMNSTFSVIVSTSKFDIETPELKIPFSFHFLSLGRSWSAMAFHHRKKRSGRNAVMRIFFASLFSKQSFWSRAQEAATASHAQVCQICPDTIYQNEEKCTKLPLNYQISIKYSKWTLYIFQMAIEYTDFFHSKALQNLPKFVFFGLNIYHLATLVTLYR
jgi:hypothetical protein